MPATDLHGSWCLVQLASEPKRWSICSMAFNTIETLAADITQAGEANLKQCMERPSPEYKALLGS